MSDNINTNTKTLIITEPTNKSTKQINCVKEKKMRIETHTWSVTEEQLTSDAQLNIVKNELKEINTEPKGRYAALCLTHIKGKIAGYKQQDILKKRLNDNEFIKLDEVIQLLVTSELKCCYCAEDVYILYERVREMKQWSLDRIDNTIGHNTNNLIIACLECNLKRRRTNKDAFLFTKNMVIIRDGI
jgi:5-methylcytosine-specific restriction endonuclease McrA